MIDGIGSINNLYTVQPSVHPLYGSRRWNDNNCMYLGDGGGWLEEEDMFITINRYSSCCDSNRDTALRDMLCNWSYGSIFPP